jgi:hypothetical protein
LLLNLQILLKARGKIGIVGEILLETMVKSLDRATVENVWKHC